MKFVGYSSKDNETYLRGLIESYQELQKQNITNSYNYLIHEPLIRAYLNYVEKPDFNYLIEKFKRNYIELESKIEPNFTDWEQKGLSSLYDYIAEFDFEKDKFNVFLTGLKMHTILYKHGPNPSFGYALRQEDVHLQGMDIKVPNHVEASKIFNSYIPDAKNKEIFKNYENNDYLKYINEAIILTTQMIHIQPFTDGNKRTFRGMLNLLLKRAGIPPIYIMPEERIAYKDALEEAMKNNNYSKILGFYHVKICNAIVSMDLEESKIIKSENPTSPKQKTLKLVPKTDVNLNK